MSENLFSVFLYDIETFKGVGPKSFEKNGIWTALCFKRVKNIYKNIFTSNVKLTPNKILVLLFLLTVYYRFLLLFN